ncbi:MAG: redoxin family protein [Candidatus Vogelbacteria bacterium]|nr:redoxin family protein [Candidatus Vogelbacteria bacterium]
MLSKNFSLGVAIIIIVLAIFYIESNKSEQPVRKRAENIAVTKVVDTEVSTSSTSLVPQIGVNLKKVTQKIDDRRKILEEKALKYPPAIEIIPGGKFINTDSFSLKQFIGKKVILVDFWTYSCINCLRTLPYLNSWYSKYKDKGFIIVGVHTPEFDFEKDYNNVVKATKDLGVEYPVVQDNDYATWSAYQNRYWPHEYLIDIDGYIVDDHIGEGGYADTETAIQKALDERVTVLGLDKLDQIPVVTPSGVVAVDSSRVGSPEMYFGSARNEYLGSGTIGTIGFQALDIPNDLEINKIYLGGNWNFQRQFAQNKSANAEIDLKYNSKSVYFVGSSDEGVNVTIYLDGKRVKNINVKDNKLYNIINGTDYGVHIVKMIVDKPGLRAFTFTFG